MKKQYIAAAMIMFSVLTGCSEAVTDDNSTQTDISSAETSVITEISAPSEKPVTTEFTINRAYDGEFIIDDGYLFYRSSSGKVKLRSCESDDSSIVPFENIMNYDGVIFCNCDENGVHTDYYYAIDYGEVICLGVSIGKGSEYDSVVDSNGDGVSELVCEMNDGSDVYIYTIVEGIVYYASAKSLTAAESPESVTFDSQIGVIRIEYTDAVSGEKVIEQYSLTDAPLSYSLYNG